MNSKFLLYVFAFLLITSCISLSTSTRFPAQAKKPRHLIVTVHGLSGNEKTWGSFGDYTEKYLETLNSKYDVQITNFIYPTGRSEKLSTFDFADLLNSHIESFFKAEPISPEDKISFVTHSQGGLVTYIWFFKNAVDEKNENKYIKHVDSIFTLGTPFWGSKMAAILTDRFTPDIVPLIKLFGGDEFQMSRRELEDLAFSSDIIEKFRHFAIHIDTNPELVKKLEALPVRLINIIGLMPDKEADFYVGKEDDVSAITKKIIHQVYKLFKTKESDIAVSVPSGRWNFLYVPPVEVTGKTHVMPGQFRQFSNFMDRSKYLFTETVHLPFGGDNTFSMAYINKNCDQVETCKHPTYRYLIEHLANCKEETCDQAQVDNIIQKMKLVNLEQHKFNKKILDSLKTYSIQLSIKMAPGTIDKFPVKFFRQTSLGEQDGNIQFELYEPYLIGEVINLHRDRNDISSTSSPQKMIWIGKKKEIRSIDIVAKTSKNVSEPDTLRVHITGHIEEKEDAPNGPVRLPLTVRLPGLPEVKVEAMVQPSYSTYIALDYTKLHP